MQDARITSALAREHANDAGASHAEYVNITPVA